MTVTFLRTKSLLPKSWRKTLGPRVQKLSIPDLEDALGAAEQILESRLGDEVQNMANDLVKLIAAKSGKSSAETPTVVVDPRTIYRLYTNTQVLIPLPTPTISESLAIGTLLALFRTCYAVEVAKGKAMTMEASTALANVRAFGEWMYFVSRIKSNAEALELLFPRQVRKAAKKKVSAKATGKSKTYWDTKLGPEKQKVIAAYEAGKPWTNVKEAAEKIHANQITTAIMYDRLYKWLLAYKNGKPF